MSQAVKGYPAIKWRAGSSSHESDNMVVEEPLEIRLGGRRFTITMRTPGHDEELAAGFLLAEGFVTARNEIDEIRRVRGSKGEYEPNALDVILKVESRALSERLKRNFVVSSSCGVCGKTSIEALERRLDRLKGDLRIAATTVLGLPSQMRGAQEVFSATGGLHAAALFGVPRSDAASLIVLREDIGRHNAVDKSVGHALMHNLIPLHRSVLMVSGRVSFEIVQKAAAAAIPILCAVSAPSSLAIDLAEELGITLVGFLRDQGFNTYSHQQRILM
ncbi:MAG TPA: formate dehydrogenase accessory sulfurtransferase FdhD [Candidatus Binataceae bacterium]|nr:formate dehydrogenase accessory sulfurtransferase FdhD [Candidatus Binataceae bacterium]